DWLYYGADAAGTRYSPLAQLTPENVSRLKIAWRFRFNEDDPYGLQVTPLKVGRLLYACSSTNRVAALDAETGAVEWLFDPQIPTTVAPFRACRGVAYYDSGENEGLCAQRIITNTIDARIIALDASTGARCSDFGENGEVSMLDGLGEHPVGYYFFNGAPLVAKGKIVVGGVVVDNQKWGEPSGVIRAVDAKTGALVWAYDVGAPERVGPPPQGEIYTPSTPNSWAHMVYDEALGLVYAPTGNATPDYFGGQRRAIDDETNSAVMALDIDTGRRRWIFQTVHHDIWDYDIGSQPTLVDIKTDAGVDRAIIQPTKRGELFLLDRQTGAPLADVEERPAPQEGAVPEERVAQTKPFSIGMPRLNGVDLRERDMWGITPFDEMWCRTAFRKARYEGQMTPPGLSPSITYPGYMGGVDWGASSVDPERGILVVASSSMANYTRLFTRAEADAAGAYPMGFGREGREALRGVLSQEGTPYGAQTKPFLSPLKAPCNRPPWGKLTAIDLKSRSIIWSRPLGSAKETGPLGMRSHIDVQIGAPLLGGAVVTRGGLVFVGATMDRTFRAVDLAGGETLWSASLDESAIATPMTYWSEESNRQFVVVAAGGHKALWTPTSDELVAYALPKKD
ncbi:MAG: pyrroloquinoline quinone-dependent dehydrogenase, partial [Amphiplicatus sp.]|nr:pyrroloquinoline quinone-dependent dehydrogenase [Amphiplicatus sp.]